MLDRSPDYGCVPTTAYLEVTDCDSLSEVVLEGKNYIRVKLKWCSSLRSVSITGNVYHLLLTHPD
jgi:hypothetical protein